MTFILDRTNGKPITPVVEVPMAQDTRQHSPPTQTFPAIGNWQTKCIIYEKLGTDNIPGSPWRAVPNYNGYQADAHGNLVYTEPNYLDVDKPSMVYPPGYEAARPTARAACTTRTSISRAVDDQPERRRDWSGPLVQPRNDLYYIPYGINPVAHYRAAGSNGLRALGQYQTGGIVRDGRVDHADDAGSK